ncbi:unnamed protein product [Ambrosiozyma monospora]|uniref:Unnamed protein product n=1 Tax=Ambrosiozyma monospora TaxID=43982 RepID=A0A9W7DJK4_AMBMO|nr:unnamed protein product [Ambrosiozyma monospora]
MMVVPLLSPRYEEFASDLSEVALQRILDCNGKLAALMINFIQSPDDTMEHPSKFEYRNGTGVKLHIAGSCCSPDGYIFCPSEDDPSKKKFIIKTWELKRPYISNYVENFPNVPNSKKFFLQVIIHCLATWTANADLLDCVNYYVCGFDFKSLMEDSGANGKTLFYNFQEMKDVSLVCAMSASTFCNIQHLHEVKRIDFKRVAEIILLKGGSFATVPEVGQGAPHDQDDDDES